MAYCTTKTCLKLIPWPFSNPGKLCDDNCEENWPIKSLLGQGMWQKLQIHCIEFLQCKMTRILNPRLSVHVDTRTGFRSAAGEVTHKCATVALSVTAWLFWGLRIHRGSDCRGLIRVRKIPRFLLVRLASAQLFNVGMHTIPDQCPQNGVCR